MVWLILAGVLAGAMDVSANRGLTEALAREEAGDTAGALAAMESLINVSPRWELPRLEAARLLLKLGGGLDRAEAHLDAVSALAPENPRSHYLRGLLWEERGQPLRAAKAYEEALRYRPSYEDARFRVAGLWFAQGDLLKAEMHYRLLIKSRPEWVQVRILMSEVLEGQGRFEDAERELGAARQFQPDNVPVKRRLADLYERTGRPRLAEKLRATLESSPPKRMRPLKPSRR
ncbi:tetratricopeptide repeat protein [Stigmatella sp. ncwal1]|uniref:Tetratricopeptide repeat protein n=1 Tax=Stigmatella ashevillensis TaxID=2995309 RepID=A0ABT5D334_9BACT|nr:tetratricopeptide repeat protein [Stigmatella ashevillena]MDC0707976.1 tetratricopeptide repeat protein [Stigmatella ashevillena]